MNNQNTDLSKSKQVYTTGEAAKICNVSQQTIIRCFDSGRLLGFKVPGSRFRRIPRLELIRFMHKNNMDMGRMGTGSVQVLVVGLSAVTVDSLIKSLAVGHSIDINHAADAWEAGFLAHQCNPKLILLNANLAGVSKNSIMTTLSEGSNEQGPMIVIVNNNQNELNVASEKDDSTEVIKQAVRQLLSA